MELNKSINDQLMAMAAHSYCLGRRTAIVSACCEWLREVWPQLSRSSQHVILRDTLKQLMDGDAGDNCDVTAWTDAARWMWDNMDYDLRLSVQSAVAWKGVPIENFIPAAAPRLAGT